MRRLIIGDIHGCFEEFQALLDKAGLGSDDEIIALGDIVDRGPDSVAVLDFFRHNPRARSLMGNHERKHIRSFEGIIKPALSQIISREQWGEAPYAEACKFMRAFPAYLELDEAILAHGFYEPGVALAQQDERVLAGVMSGEAIIQKRCSRPWYEMYDGARPLVVAHRDYCGGGQPLIYKDRVYGLDTGCCCGGALTGLLLPGFGILTVPSRANYWAEAKRKYAGKKRLAEADRFAGMALAQIQTQYRQLMDGLHKEAGFDQLAASEQIRRFSAAAALSPLAGYFHQMRKGALTLESLRTKLQASVQARKLFEHLAPPIERTDNDEEDDE